MKGRKHTKKMAAGGKAKDSHLYNAVGSPEAHEIDEKSDGFKRGGHKRKHGGHVDGEKSHVRLDKKARGGKMHRKLGTGGTPYSSAHKESGPESGGKGNGHYGNEPAEVG